jgi:hypothetical protein
MNFKYLQLFPAEGKSPDLLSASELLERGHRFRVGGRRAAFAELSLRWNAAPLML